MNKSFDNNIFSITDKMNLYDDVGYTLYGNRIMKPMFSIMIPTYKRMDYLKKAIRSALQQRTDVLFEVVVVDNDPDNSEDEIRLMLDEFNDHRLSYYKNHKNIGMFGNWNRCITLALAEWLLVLNDDDELESDYLSKIINVISKRKNCAAVSCKFRYIDEQGNYTGKKRDIYQSWKKDKAIDIEVKDFYYTHPVTIYGCSFRKSFAKKIGGFNEDFYPCSDAVFLLNLCTLGKVELVRTYLFKYRWAVNESQNITTQQDFLRFNNKKSMQINNRIGLYGNRTDAYLRDCMTSYSVSALLKKGLISKEDVVPFLKDAQIDVKYSRLRAEFYSVLLKIIKIRNWAIGRYIS